MDDRPAEDVAEPAPVKGEDETNGAPTQESISGSEGSGAIRPIFLGNLMPNYSLDDVSKIFEKPGELNLNEETRSFPVDRIDVKRGFCFVFLKDAKSQASIEEIETFLRLINGIDVPGVSRRVRVEFARGDGRVKRKEDERKNQIAPSETLFVVGFKEETTHRQDLEMLFERFGELVRIDLKRNYAFVQFKTIREATVAKEKTDQGKLESSTLTVEFVARQRNIDRRGGGPSRGRYDDRRHDDRRRYDDRRGPPARDSDYDRDRGRRGHSPQYSRRRDSPPPYRGGGSSRGRSRSRSPPRYRGRSRSPPRRYSNDGGYDDYRGGGGRDEGYRRGGSPSSYRRGPSPGAGSRRGPSPDRYRGGDRDRGYRG